MSYKNVLIVAFGNTGNEPEALRQVLESFDYFVAIYYIGRPDDFKAVLTGTVPFAADCIIFSCHGEEGSFVMPVLGEEIYREGEVRGNYSAGDVAREIMLRDKLILSLGCTTGSVSMGKVFGAANSYIAPVDYVEGKAALFFAVKLFYKLTQDDVSLERAFALAKAEDVETELFVMAGDSLLIG